MHAARHTNPVPRASRRPALRAWTTTSLAMCSAATGILPRAQRSPTTCASGSTTSRAKPLSPRTRNCSPTSPSSRSRSNETTAASNAPWLDSSISRASDRFSTSSMGCTARSPIRSPRLDQPGERPEQGDLLGGIGTVPVRLPRGTDDGVPPFPRAQAGRRQAGKPGGFVNLVRPVPPGDCLGVRVPTGHVTITEGRSSSPTCRYTLPSEKIPRRLSLRPRQVVAPRYRPA